MDENGANSRKASPQGDEFAEVGPWAKEKLQALQRYLDYYTKVLKKQPWRTIYIDAFAGGGRAIVRSGKKVDRESHPLFGEGSEPDAEAVELIDGSPRIALSIPNVFDRYVFVDPDAKRVRQLESLRDEFDGRVKISVRSETAAEAIDWLLGQNIKKATHRGVAFLDPFGANLEWASLAKLAQTGLFEVVINFPLNMAIMRMLPNNGVVPDSWGKKLDELFGDRAWFEAAYRPKTSGLFQDDGYEKQPQGSSRLLELYRGRLNGAFGHVSEPRLIRNTRGTPLYYLIWAGPHKKGLEGANYVLKMGDKIDRSRVRGVES
jgi:three-Cys-motif partner protein